MTTLYEVPVTKPSTKPWSEIWNFEVLVPQRTELAGNVVTLLWPIINQATITGRDLEETIGDQFRRLAEQWRNETSMLSSPTETILHPAYWRIILMGLSVVPLILRDLRETGGYWFVALEKITGATPPGANSSDLDQVIEAWLNWGRANEYIV